MSNVNISKCESRSNVFNANKNHFGLLRSETRWITPTISNSSTQDQITANENVFGIMYCDESYPLVGSGFLTIDRCHMNSWCLSNTMGVIPIVNKLVYRTENISSVYYNSERVHDILTPILGSAFDTNQMSQSSNFVGWNFVNIWFQDYCPKLRNFQSYISSDMQTLYPPPPADAILQNLTTPTWSYTSGLATGPNIFRGILRVIADDSINWILSGGYSNSPTALNFSLINQSAPTNPTIEGHGTMDIAYYVDANTFSYSRDVILRLAQESPSKEFTTSINQLGFMYDLANTVTIRDSSYSVLTTLLASDMIKSINVNSSPGQTHNFYALPEYYKYVWIKPRSYDLEITLGGYKVGGTLNQNEPFGVSLKPTARAGTHVLEVVCYNAGAWRCVEINFIV